MLEAVVALAPEASPGQESVGAAIEGSRLAGSCPGLESESENGSSGVYVCACMCFISVLCPYQ